MLYWSSNRINNSNNNDEQKNIIVTIMECKCHCNHHHRHSHSHSHKFLVLTEVLVVEAAAMDPSRVEQVVIDQVQEGVVQGTAVQQVVMML
jgi:hypothetical protein